jgi:FkbM family methyltransferase
MKFFGVTKYEYFPFARDEFNWYYPFAELETKFFISNFLTEQKSFIDVGANIGTLTFIAAKKTHRILSIEADEFNFSILDKNLNFYNLSSIDLHNCYLSDSDGFENVKYWSSFGNQLIDQYQKVVTLDTVISSFKYAPDLIKIDTDGGELKILKGMNKTLNNKCVIVIETNRDKKSNSGQDLGKIKKVLKMHNYRLVGFLDYENAVFCHDKILQNKYLLWKSKRATKKVLKLLKNKNELKFKTIKLFITKKLGFSDCLLISKVYSDSIEFKVTVIYKSINIVVLNSDQTPALSLTIPPCFNQYVKIDLTEIKTSGGLYQVTLRSGPGNSRSFGYIKF